MAGGDWDRVRRSRTGLESSTVTGMTVTPHEAHRGWRILKLPLVAGGGLQVVGLSGFNTATEN